LGSRGSIVARPKLKRIDGRAPPGVEFAARRIGRDSPVYKKKFIESTLKHT